MRVIAGKFRSRQLKSLKGLALRPTSDRLRETLFNVLSPVIEGARFLDLFAGTGAVGIEAISRGAAEAVLIENHAAAAKLIRANLASLEITGAQVIAADALQALEKLSAGPKSPIGVFDIVFLDPPYAATREYEKVLRFLASSSLLTLSSIVVAEHTRKLVLPESIGSLARHRLLQQGDAALSFFSKNESGAANS